MKAPEKSMGNSVSHDSAELHVTGAATYTDDIPEPAGCLHACILKSPYARARIVKMDVSPCRIPGVHAVLTAADIPGVNDVAPATHGDPVFAEGEVFYAGQSVLAVAAETPEIAREAAHKAVVSYEELPAILDVHTALKEKSFVGEPYAMRIGDSAAGIKNSKNTLSGELNIGGQDHFYLETHIALATPKEGNEIHCWSATQHPSEVQHLIAKVLKIPEHAVTVEVRRLGGGFGGKETQAALFACIAALLARKTGRAVKLRLDRDDDMLMTGKRHDFHVSYKVGFDDSGVIGGIDMTHLVNCGMSADLSNAIADRAMFHADNTYFLGNATVTSYRCKTNKASNTAFRGFGAPQGMLAIECIMDDIARVLGKDPLGVRKANFYDHRESIGKRAVTHYHMDVEDNVIHDIFAQLEKSSDYAGRVKAIREFNDENKILKKGIAFTPVKFGISFTLTMLNQAGALIHIYKDGSIQLNHGGTEMGQGLHTKITQIVAHAFGVGIDNVKITATSTGKVPNTSATAASSGTDLNGKAAEAAAHTIKERLIDFAAAHFGTEKQDILFKSGHVHIGGQVLLFKDLVQLAYANRVSLSSTGFYKTPKIGWDRAAGRGRPFLYFTYGASVSEVIVDTLTGEYKVLRCDILHDAGRSLNPALDIGQIEGGFAQGMGWLTTEELWWNEKGELKTHAPGTYKIPTARDIPRDFRVALFRGENREDTVARSKAVGEPPFMHGISVFLALRDAVSSVRKNPRLNAPATPEEILRVLSS
ncbi:MAG: xanthine dehydrogenase molybdopterin binding subunit [Pseudomonadota bacterium]